MPLISGIQEKPSGFRPEYASKRYGLLGIQSWPDFIRGVSREIRLVSNEHCLHFFTSLLLRFTEQLVTQW
jgi:hypothetical protein